MEPPAVMSAGTEPAMRNCAWLFCLAFLFGFSVWLFCLAFLFGFSVWPLCLACLFARRAGLRE
jgi:hypothetical protein